MSTVELSGVPDFHTINSPRNGTSKSHHQSSHKHTPKSLNSSFDFTPLGEDLPPNTGPAGSVSSNQSTTSKNLSHVPCKFYRQGICQAGSTCPFSHNLDGSLAADKLPCKYFQKGNCKFGLKCALAHFLPDGTRVNSKNLGRRYHNHHNHQNGANNSSSYNSAPVAEQTSSSSNGGASSPDAMRHSASNSSLNENGATSASGYGTLGTSGFGNSKNSGSISISAPGSASGRNGGFFSSYNPPPEALGSQTQVANFINIKSRTPFDYSMINTQTTSALSTSNTTPTTGMFRSYSSTTSPIGLSKASPQSNFFPSTIANQSPTNYNNSMTALFSSKPSARPLFSADSDDFRRDAYESVFEEDYVPGSLGDLILTPQELQRRDSRSQSGTLLVRPNLNTMFSSNTMKDFELKSRDDGKLSPNEVFLMD